MRLGLFFVAAFAISGAALGAEDPQGAAQRLSEAADGFYYDIGGKTPTQETILGFDYIPKIGQLRVRAHSTAMLKGKSDTFTVPLLEVSVALVENEDGDMERIRFRCEDDTRCVERRYSEIGRRPEFNTQFYFGCKQEVCRTMLDDIELLMDHAREGT